MKIKSIILVILFQIIMILPVPAESNNDYTVKDGNLYYKGEMITNIEYQMNADIIRLKHLQYYGNIIQEYYKKTGKYPLESSSQTFTYVYIANSKQAKYVKDYDKAIPYKHKTVSFKKFIKVLEKGLGRKIDEFYDPQYYPDAKPNWYIYAIKGNTFYFAIHVHQRFPFSKFIYPYCFKVEISNKANKSANLIIIPEELFNSKLFLDEANKKIKNEDHFIEIEEKFKNETKIK